MPVSQLLLTQARVSGRGDDAPVASTALSKCITPLVSVPVLSLQRMSMLPKFWIAGRLLHDHLLARQSQRATRQRDRADHRQELRCEADAQRHCEEQRLERVVPEAQCRSAR